MLRLFRRHGTAREQETGIPEAVDKYAFESGERQTATSFAGIRGDHIQRYEAAISVFKDILPRNGRSFLLDSFCGNGYGTRLVSDRLGCHALGIDASEGAIACANAHYATQRVFFCAKVFPFDLPKAVFDGALCVESLEHVDAAGELLRTIADSLKPGGMLFVSTPNERLYPFRLDIHPFHVRHYRREEIEELVCGIPGDLRLLEWYGQDIYDESGHVVQAKWGVKPNEEKQILMFAYRKAG